LKPTHSPARDKKNSHLPTNPTHAQTAESSSGVRSIIDSDIIKQLSWQYLSDVPFERRTVEILKNGKFK